MECARNMIRADALLSSLLDPLEGLSMVNCGKLELGGRSRLPALKRVRGACQKSRDQTRKKDNMFLHSLASKTNHKLVRTHSAFIWCWDKPRATSDSLYSPQPRLGGSHHLSPYSILYVTLWEPHLNGTFSQDSQGEVPKLSRVGLPGLWELTSPGSNL